jgi:hypothetical protein
MALLVPFSTDVNPVVILEMEVQRQERIEPIAAPIPILAGSTQERQRVVLAQKPRIGLSKCLFD